MLRSYVRERNGRSQNTFKTSKCINELIESVEQVGYRAEIRFVIFAAACNQRYALAVGGGTALRSWSAAMYELWYHCITSAAFVRIARVVRTR